MAPMVITIRPPRPKRPKMKRPKKGSVFRSKGTRTAKTRTIVSGS